jgi:hypothetical protein
MDSINANALNFSESALKHFNDALMQRGKGNGVKLGIKKKRAALAMNTLLNMLIILMKLLLM